MRMKKLVARVCVGAGVALFSLLATATPASAGTTTVGKCLEGGGKVIEHGGWTGCHGDGWGSSGTKILD